MITASPPTNIRRRLQERGQGAALILPACLVLKEMNMITATYEGSPAEPVYGSTLLPQSLCDDEAVNLPSSPEKAPSTRSIGCQAHMTSDDVRR